MHLIIMRLDCRYIFLKYIRTFGDFKDFTTSFKALVKDFFGVI